MYNMQSDCHYVRPMPILRLNNECTYRHTFWTTWYGHHPSFVSPTAITKFQVNPSLSAGGVEYPGMGFSTEIAVYLERCEMGQWLVTMDHQQEVR